MAFIVKLLLITLLSLLQGVRGQLFEFPDGIIYASKCGIKQGEVWSVNGTLTIKEEKLNNFFTPVVTFLSRHKKICDIDLTSCSKVNISNGPDMCFCSEQNGDVYNLEVIRRANGSDSLLPLYVEIPLKYSWYTRKWKTQIGTFPIIFDSSRADVEAFVYVDKNVQTLVAYQTIEVHRGQFTPLKVCVQNLLPETVLYVSKGDVELRTKSSCIDISTRFRFENLQSYRVVVSFNEQAICPRAGNYNIDVVAAPSSVSETTTTKPTIVSSTISIPTNPIKASQAHSKTTKITLTTTETPKVSVSIKTPPANSNTTRTTTIPNTEVPTTTTSTPARTSEATNHFFMMESSGKFTPLLTPRTTLRCSLNDPVKILNPAFVKRHNITSSDVHIVTIQISKDHGQDVALITNETKPEGLINQDRMYTTGEVYEHQGHQKGYLEVGWSHPTSDQAGEYKCDVRGLTNTGHTVQFSKSLTLDAIPPSIDTLVDYVHGLKKENMELQKDMKELQEERKYLKNNISELKLENIDLRNKSKAMQIVIWDLNNNISHLKTENAELKNNSETAQIVFEDLKNDLKEENENRHSENQALHLILGGLKNNISGLQKENKNFTNSIEDLQKEDAYLKIKDQAMQSLYEGLRDNVSALWKENHNLINSMNNINRENQNITSQMDNLESQTALSIDTVQHIEHGRSSCSPKPGEHIDSTITFKTSYKRAPIVQTSIWQHNLHFRNGDVRSPVYYVNVKQVNAGSFIVQCYIREDTYRLGYLHFTWISLPSP